MPRIASSYRSIILEKAILPAHRPGFLWGWGGWWWSIITSLPSLPHFLVDGIGHCSKPGAALVRFVYVDIIQLLKTLSQATIYRWQSAPAVLVQLIVRVTSWQEESLSPFEVTPVGHGITVEGVVDSDGRNHENALYYQAVSDMCIANDIQFLSGRWDKSHVQSFSLQNAL